MQLGSVPGRVSCFGLISNKMMLGTVPSEGEALHLLLCKAELGCCACVTFQGFGSGASSSSCYQLSKDSAVVQQKFANACVFCFGSGHSRSRLAVCSRLCCCCA
jgi:hypothetical protein